MRTGKTSGARWAVASAAATFVLVTLALAFAAETVKPEWRDPEYGHRLRAARKWQRERPDRPLVVVLGSSRAQMETSPADMAFPDEPGSPLVYNFGYRRTGPLLMWLQLARLLDDGLRPRAVLLVLSDDEIRATQPADEVARAWKSRFSAADLRRLAPYAADPAALGRSGTAWNPWAGRRAALVTNLPEAWQMADLTHTASWERMDAHGYSPFPARNISPTRRDATMGLLRQFRASLNDTEVPSPLAMRILLDLTARCLAEGIAVAASWAPDSPANLAMYTPSAWATRKARDRALIAALGIPVFPAPDDLTDDDFADGAHLRASGASRYSRWLADTHLKPWLVRVKLQYRRADAAPLATSQ